jgi:hypothetical protein
MACKNYLKINFFVQAQALEMAEVKYIT